MKYLYVSADTNDADYIGTLRPITDEEIELIRPVVEAIQNFVPYEGVQRSYGSYLHRHNYPEGDVLRSDLGEKSPKEMYGHLPGFETFQDFIPYNEYGGIHTIETVMVVTSEEILL